MAVKGPPPAPAPVNNWTGFYVGGNVGYGWGNANTDLNGSATTIVVIVGSTPFPNSFAFAASNRAHLDGVIGGGQIGYNYQSSPNWVLGLEADFQGSDQRGGNTFVAPFSTVVCSSASFPPPTCNAFTTFNGTAVTNYNAKIDWFGTVRGRLGYLITPQVLFYGTGGLAYGDVEVSGNTVASFFKTSGNGVFSASKTNVGFSVGGGIEGSAWLPANWTWKLEYLYLDLGSLDVVTSLNFGSGTGTTTTHTHFTDNIVRVGLNYQFH
jgi:outer membrane immunogenic protein